ncbi:MAG: T9SS type A sorting domain-containing protein [Breznakibacter sp.]
MNPRILLIILLIVVGIDTPWAKNLTLFVKLQNGNVEPVNSSPLKKSAHSNGNLTLNYTNRPAFSSTSDAKTINADYGTLSIQMDHENNILYIKNLVSTSSVTIYSINGSIALAKQISVESPSLDVASLPKGIYLLKINNQVFKFIRE